MSKLIYALSGMALGALVAVAIPEGSGLEDATAASAKGFVERAPAFRIERSAVVTHVELIGPWREGEPPAVVMLDPDGNVVFRQDPAQNATFVARDVIVPSVTVRSDAGATAELRLVTAAAPVAAGDLFRETGYR